MYSVLNYLEALIAKSNIHETLVNEANGEVPSTTLADGSLDLGQVQPLYALVISLWSEDGSVGLVFFSSTCSRCSAILP